MKKWSRFFFAAAVCLPAAFEVDPGINDCIITGSREGTKIEFRCQDHPWHPAPPVQQSKTAPNRWSSRIKDLTPGTDYEFRAKYPEGKIIHGKFSTQKKQMEQIIRFSPTFENCAWSLHDRKGKSCSVEYREENGVWQQAFAPVWVPRERIWRGALMQLKENTVYEVQIKLEKQTFSGKFRTQNSHVKTGRNISLKQIPETFQSGSSNAWIRYTAETPLKGNIILKDASFIILDGITIDANQANHAIWLDNCSNIIIRNCNISNFGAPAKRSWIASEFGQYMHGNKPVLSDCGLRIRNSKNILAERNIIHSPAGKTSSWYYSAPSGVNAVVLDCAKEGVVIRHNDFAARDLQRFNDAISCTGEENADGGFGFNADIYGNYFAFVNDDACELDGAGRNIRFYFNRLEQFYSGVSTGRCTYGPVYIFRNLFVNPGDQHGHYANAIKNFSSVQGLGDIYLLNNTVSTANGGVYPAISHIHNMEPETEYNGNKLYSRGNIFSGRFMPFVTPLFKWPCNLDYDVIDIATGNKRFFRILKTAADMQQLEQHPNTPKKKIPWEFTPDEFGQEKNAVFGKVQFKDPAAGLYQLKKNSCGINLKIQGTLPKMKNAGAFQNDQVQIIPHREYAFSASALYRSTQGKEVVFQIKANKTTAFSIVANDDFYTLSPTRGKLQKGDKLTITVTAKSTPLNRIYRGTVFLRTDNGYSLPLGFAFDRRNNPVDGITADKNGEIKIIKEGDYFVFLKGYCLAGKGEISVNNDEYKIQYIPFRRKLGEWIRINNIKTRTPLRLHLRPGTVKVALLAEQRIKLKMQEIMLTTDPDSISNHQLQEESSLK